MLFNGTIEEKKTFLYQQSRYYTEACERIIHANNKYNKNCQIISNRKTFGANSQKSPRKPFAMT